MYIVEVVFKRINVSVTPIIYSMNLTNLPYALLVFISLSKLIYADEKKDTPLPLAQAVEEVYPAIVRIEVVSEQGSSGRMMKARATGSGVIV